MSNNVRPVKSYLSALLLALQRSVLFSLLIDLFIDDQGSRVIDRLASVRPIHLSDQNFDRDYFFDLPFQRAASPIKSRVL
jgi:hypothetical protein